MWRRFGRLPLPSIDGSKSGQECPGRYTREGIEGAVADSQKQESPLGAGFLGVSQTVWDRSGQLFGGPGSFELKAGVPVIIGLW